VLEITEAAWDRVLGVNLKAPFLLSQAAAPLLRAGGGGAIINLRRPVRAPAVAVVRAPRRLQGRPAPPHARPRPRARARHPRERDRARHRTAP
jgi:hypothetical protein